MIALARKVIVGFVLGTIAGALLYLESALVLPRRLSVISWLICCVVLAAVFIAEAKRILNVLTRGFATIALLCFLLYPAGMVFQMKVARSSGGEVTPMRDNSSSEKALEWFIEDLTSAKISGGIGILFSVLALLSWAGTKK